MLLAGNTVIECRGVSAMLLAGNTVIECRGVSHALGKSSRVYCDRPVPVIHTCSSRANVYLWRVRVLSAGLLWWLDGLLWWLDGLLWWLDGGLMAAWWLALVA